MIFRLILPDWAKAENPKQPKVLEGEFNQDQLTDLNLIGYNVYFLPNYPSHYTKGITVDGSHIDIFEYVFVDMDLKDGKYFDKDAFISTLVDFKCSPSRIVDSGNGIHAYWRVTDLTGMAFLRLQRRLQRHLHTDEAVAKIYQLMRLQGSLNTKERYNPKPCEVLYENNTVYTSEQLDAILPPISKEDEDYCKQHYDKTYKITPIAKVGDALPIKFCKLIKDNNEIRDIWKGDSDDRSKSDYRLGHLLFANGFTKDEAMSVLVNAAKALERSPSHRISYAQGIIDKIWTFELEDQKNQLSHSVRDILARGEATISGTRFSCNKLIDDTAIGFRLGHVIGLVAGSGVGKTSMAINMFKWFTEHNPDYDHFFVSLEQTDNEIADRWRTICQGDERLHDKVHILSNYDEKGTFRHLSLDDIRMYLLEFQKKSGRKIGTCVIDHIGALRKQNKNGENEAIVDICHKMKSFAVETNTLVIMQSQAPREKAGIGDLELTKDSAYGTVFFESYVDWLLTIWQPLKRNYVNGAPTVMAFKYCKIRHKKQGVDRIQEDVCYRLMFEPLTERLRELTQAEDLSADFHQNQCINIRKKDRKTDVVPYQSRRIVDESTHIDKNTT